MNAETAKRRVVQEVDRQAEQLVDVSHRIHARPELMFEERFASDLLASVLEARGLEVTRHAGGLETAFVARAGDGPGPTVAVLCEYDALPGVGHACGHNVIAAAGLGAGLAAAAVVVDAGGSLVVLGTPAEEGGGGKILLADQGLFEGVDAALMVHPSGADLFEPEVLAVASWEVTYRGHAAHAAAFPDEGRNALDAAVLGYNAVAALRQHIASTDRVHGIFTAAGEKPNIVPDRAVAQWFVRSATIASLQPLKARVRACLEGGALAAGCELEVRPTAPEYADLRTNRPLCELYSANSERVGRPVSTPAPGQHVVVSTDMGNVSHLVPSIHPMIKVAPAHVHIHSADFTGWAASAEADGAVLDAAKAMAMTAVDLWLQPGAREQVRAAFDSGP